MKCVLKSGQQIMRLPDGRQYLLTLAAPKSQPQQSITTLTPGSSLQPPSGMVLGQKIVMSQANTPQFVVTGNAPGASKSLFVLGATPNSHVLPTLGRPRLVTAVQQQQQPAIVRMTSGQQITLRSVIQPVQRAAVVSTPQSVIRKSEPTVIQSGGYSLLNSALSPSSEATSSYSVTPQVVQQGSTINNIFVTYYVLHIFVIYKFISSMEDINVHHRLAPVHAVLNVHHRLAPLHAVLNVYHRLAPVHAVLNVHHRLASMHIVLNVHHKVAPILAVFNVHHKVAPMHAVLIVHYKVAPMHLVFLQLKNSENRKAL